MIFVTVYFNNRKIKVDMNKDNENKLEKKASVKYVDTQDKVLHHRIDEIKDDNDSLSDKIDANQQFIIERLDNMNNNILNIRK
jgi:FtsZ-binding cell division protein ZapB